jgi:peroxiredoxin 2/4
MHHDVLNNSRILPRINDIAPDFSANTTIGPIQFHEWKKDKWAILFSHPADFTPVCSTELTQFAKDASFFAQKNALLIGLSVDSIHSHLAWIQNLKTILDVELPFPMIADLKAKVAESYGMIHPHESETLTVRTLFIVDPKNKIRASIYYPLNVGRNTEEVKRLLTALQTSDAKQVACPVNWKVGEKVIVPPPKTMVEVKEREHASYEKLDFYLCKKDI